ncbi:MAG: hypothetical protein JEZ14_26840 [Marinilabiliaceae bacterium]|nr:hypothetical protein [Marinilabiliaceae bacterium]
MGRNNKTSGRPWQGTILGVISSVGVITLVFILGSLLFARDMISPYLVKTPFALLLGAGTFVMFMILLFGIILSLSITFGVFNGKTWAIILSILFTGMSMIEALFVVSPIAIIAYGLLLYLEIVCVRHSFYYD